MATNQDFDNLIQRIDVATGELEQAVSIVVDGSVGVEQLVEQAQGAANTAVSASQEAETYSSNAANSSAAAQEAFSQADALVEELKATAPFDEAPINGSTYGRNNGNWVLVEGGGGSGGTVVSVNNKNPDSQGNVELEYSDIPGTPTIPTVPTDVSAFINDANYIADAPQDGNQYARQNGAWSQVESGGGGGSSYTLPNNVTVEPNYTYKFTVSPAIAAATRNVEHQRWIHGEGLTESFNTPLGPDQVYLESIANSWSQDGSIPLTTNPTQAIDIFAVKCVRILDDLTEDDILRPTVENSYNASTSAVQWHLKTFGYNSLFVSGIAGNQLRKAMLPGNWYVAPEVTANISNADWNTASGLPNTMKGMDLIYSVIELPIITTGPTAYRVKRLITITFMPTTVASKLVYMWDGYTSKWVNIGTGTA